MLRPTRFITLGDLALVAFLVATAWFAVIGMVVTAQWGAAWIAGVLAS